jgi:hypothetical protein
VLPEKKVGILDGRSLPGIKPDVLPADMHYINLTQAWDDHRLAQEQDTLLKINDETHQALEAAYACFAEALNIHDRWEEIYIGNLNIPQANLLAEEIAQTLVGDAAFPKPAVVKHRFLGAATPQGAVDFIPDLTKDIPRRYFLKGRPGTGKSTLLKKLVAAAEKHGLAIEVYHCGFDPHSLDMVILRELDVCILDSTAPHEYYPSREGDEIIDLYEKIIAPGTDTLHAAAIAQISAEYKAMIKKATAYLAEAKVQQDKADEIIQAACDTAMVAELLQQCTEELDSVVSGA